MTTRKGASIGRIGIAAQNAQSEREEIVTSNSQLKRKNIDLKMENSNLIDLRYALMSDNRRLERERNELQTLLDLSAQALDDMTQQRDEARAWARRMKRERDALRDLLGMMDVAKIAENLELMRKLLND